MKQPKEKENNQQVQQVVPAVERMPEGYVLTFQDIATLVMRSFGEFNPKASNQQLFVLSFLSELDKQYVLGLFTTIGVEKMERFIHNPDRSDAYLDFIARLQIACSTVGFNEIDINNFLLSTYNIFGMDEAYRDIIPPLVCLDKEKGVYSLVLTYGLKHCYLILYKMLLPYFYAIIDQENAKAMYIAEQQRIKEDRQKTLRDLASEEK